MDTLTCISCKDTQLKIDSHHVELEKDGHHMRERLPNMCQQATEESSWDTECVPRFSLIGDVTDFQSCCEEIAANYGLSAEAIIDIYPCTPLQESILAFTSKWKEGYILQNVLEITSNICIKSFREAWEFTIQSTPILRTRVVQHSQLGLLQIVLNDDIQWTEAESFQAYLDRDNSLSMALGEPLSRYALICNRKTQRCWFVWTIHHALYDGISLSLVLDMVHKVYNGHFLLARPQFNVFVKHLVESNRSAATAYWQSMLSGYQGAPFPSLDSALQEPIADTIIKLQCPLPAVRSNTTLATAIRGALAIVLSHHTGSADVVFGATISGRNTAIRGIEDIVGPTIATVPVRVQIYREQTVLAYLQNLQNIAIDMIPYEQTGLQQIAKVSTDARQACGFQTLLVIQAQKADAWKHPLFEGWKMNSSLRAFNTYALTLSTHLTNDGIEMVASFDSRVISKWGVQKILEQFSFVLRQLSEASPLQKLGKIKILTPADRDLLWTWNSPVPEVVKQCVHKLVEERARSQPRAAAVCAWDGDLTYEELDKLASQIARRLVELGVGPNVVVPLCFEKSRWTSVAILAVLKAGGAFVLLDPYQPEKRLHSIVQQTKSVVMLSSCAHRSLSSRLVDHVISIGPDSSQLQLDKTTTTAFLQGSPSSIMYIVFTSGSTGTPKGVIISHDNFSSAIHHQLRCYSINSESRVFDFMSYSFDVSIQNTLSTFVAGGCLCVPSEQDRKDNLANAIIQMGANVVTLTPSIIRLLSPEALPTLTTLISIGEPLHYRDISRWVDQVRIINTYGPSECTTASTINYQTSDPTLLTRLGKGVGVITWVVDAADHNILLPVGVVGELLLEGPIVGRGYLGDHEKSTEAFVRDPRWLLQGTPGRPGRRGRLYKTGDLVRYNDDGSLTFISRKDTQVKIRGHRVELEEVEHHIRECLPDVRQLAAEVILPGCGGENSNAELAVFMTVNDEPHGGGEERCPRVVPMAAEIEDKLAVYLPSYMVPTLFIALNQVPMTPSGKTDRKRLRQIGASFSAQQLADLRSTVQGEKRQPTSEIECMLQHLWARALDVDPANIGLDDNFFRLGGDSIAAMKVAGEARKAGIELHVNDIFRLTTIAALVTTDLSPSVDVANASETARFSLVPPAIVRMLYSNLNTLSGAIEPSEIVDILPVTCAQEDYLKLSNRGIQQFFLDLGPKVNVENLKRGCHLLLQSLPILRTVFISLLGAHWQVVLKQPKLTFNCLETNEDISVTTQDIIHRERISAIPLGSALTSFTLIHHEVSGYRLIIHISHAQYDGICLPFIVQSLLSAYQNMPVGPRVGFSAYIAHIHKQRDKSVAYWSRLLKGSYLTFIIPKLNECVGYEPISDLVEAQRSITAPVLPCNATVASLVTSAWAVILSGITKEEDVVFGRLVAGRNAAICGIEDIVGPCLNTIPVRVQIRPKLTGVDLLNSVQQQHLSVGEADSLGREELMRCCTDWPMGAVFDSVVKHFGFDERPKFRLPMGNIQLQHFASSTTTARHLSISSFSEGDQLRLKIEASCQLLKLEIAEKLVVALVDVITKLSTSPKEPLGTWTQHLELLGVKIT